MEPIAADTLLFLTNQEQSWSSLGLRAFFSLFALDASKMETVSCFAESSFTLLLQFVLCFIHLLTAVIGLFAYKWLIILKIFLFCLCSYRRNRRQSSRAFETKKVNLDIDQQTICEGSVSKGKFKQVF